MRKCRELLRRKNYNLLICKHNFFETDFSETLHNGRTTMFVVKRNLSPGPSIIMAAWRRNPLLRKTVERFPKTCWKASCLGMSDWATDGCWGPGEDRRGNRSQSARILGLTRQGLLNKIARYNILSLLWVKYTWFKIIRKAPLFWFENQGSNSFAF